MRLLLCLALFMTGCSATDTAPAANACQAAADHLAACEGRDPVPAVGDCDPAQAQAILDADCEAIGGGLNDAKSDSTGFRAWGCRIGLYRYCDAQACDAEADEANFEPLAAPDEGSACLQDALAYRGCGACAYYACREETANCGEDNYLMRFAHAYCVRYRQSAEPNFSPQGQRWLRDVRRCLVESLDANAPGDDCDTIEAEGFASHPGCYLSTGFCDLPFSDWLGTLNTIDYRDTPLRQVLVTGIQCLGERLGVR
ncbi:MAG: hypothetical protein ACI9U2_004860 [Bradymonadia bacterium]|jgi:hypothetical protein